MIWSDARELTADTIYNELDDKQLKEKTVLGCWMMDDARGGPINQTKDASPHNNPAEVIGADHINQTAPIFRAGNKEFEASLGGLSVGMGLSSLTKPIWLMTQPSSSAQTVSSICTPQRAMTKRKRMGS